MSEPQIWNYFQWLLSAATVVFTLLAGKKHRATWWVAVFVQALWTVYIVATKQWGLMPMNVVLWVLYLRNLVLWRRDSGFVEMSTREKAQSEAFKKRLREEAARVKTTHIYSDR